jgi:hypothetical protein
MDLGHWTLSEGLYCPSEFFGFIYEITNIVTGKFYIGKKQCLRKIKRKPLKGKTRNRIDHKESDWKSYAGSSNDLLEDIKKYSKENFTFKILRFCNSKWELSYFEAKEQMSRDVLLIENSYNGILNLRIGKAPKSFLNIKDK